MVKPWSKKATGRILFHFLVSNTAGIRVLIPAAFAKNENVHIFALSLTCGYSLVVGCDLPKVETRVRFSVPAQF